MFSSRYLVTAAGFDLCPSPSIDCYCLARGGAPSPLIPPTAIVQHGGVPPAPRRGGRGSRRRRRRRAPRKSAAQPPSSAAAAAVAGGPVLSGPPVTVARDPPPRMQSESARMKRHEGPPLKPPYTFKYVTSPNLRRASCIPFRSTTSCESVPNRLAPAQGR